MRILASCFWLVLAFSSTAALIRAGNEYVTTVRSLQDSQWAILQFDAPPDSAERTGLVLEIRNPSGLDLRLKELEVYLWRGDMTVGKTYGHVEPLLVPRGSVKRIPLVIELNSEALRAAGVDAGGRRWRAAGSYKISTALTGSDFVYHLDLDVAP